MASNQFDHVIFISIDTMRSDVVAATPDKLWPAKYPGLRQPRTDVLDDLARSGTFLPNTITAAPYTAAAHGSIFTGQYPLHSGVHEFYNGQLRSPSVFAYGRRAGRRTILKVDFPIILGPQLGFTRDIDVYLVEKDDEFIDAVVAAESTVACAHFGGVHQPYGFHNLHFGGDAYRETVARLEAQLPAGLPEQADQLVESYRDDVDTDLLLRYKRAVNHLYAEGHHDTLFQLYLDGVEHFLRTRFEPFLAKLTAGIAATGRRALLVVFADHGHEFDERSFGHFNSMSGRAAGPRHDLRSGPPGTHCDCPHRRPRSDSAGAADPVTAAAGLMASLAATVRDGTPPGGDRPALAEAYTSDAGEFVAYQRRQLRGEQPGPLRHVLVGQAAYLGDRRVVRIPNRYTANFAAIEPTDQTWVETFDEHLVPRVDPAADRPLLAMLAGYHTGRRPRVDVPVDESVRSQLRALGYSI
jgi:hypothetical protein